VAAAAGGILFTQIVQPIAVEVLAEQARRTTGHLAQVAVVAAAASLAKAATVARGS
jgi:hypothetical protein